MRLPRFGRQLWALRGQRVLVHTAAGQDLELLPLKALRQAGKLPNAPSCHVSDKALGYGIAGAG